MNKQHLEELEALQGLIEHMPDGEKKRRLARSQTLVLNADYLPISVLPLHTVDWMEAVTLVFKEKCAVVESYDDLVINSPSTSWRVPSILVNNRYVRPKRKVEYSKHNVFLRDDYRCQYCGDYFSGAQLTQDHWVPRKEGGKTVWNNIVSACKKCNHKKSTQNQKRWKPRTIPYKPEFAELAAKARKRRVTVQDPRWIRYLSWKGPIHVNDGMNTYEVEEIKNGD
jgi:5-methylcytosine-specific restriction endonuclease McrA